MIRINELYRLDKIKNLRLVAGEGGLERMVTEAVLFEFDPSHMQLADFYKDDLVVTTLAYARGDVGLMTDSLLALMNQGAACIMVKTAYFSRMPLIVLENADKLQTPLFLFDDTYIEEVIVEVTDLLRGKHHFPGYEREISALMRGEMTPEQIRGSFRRMAPRGSMPYQAAALCPDEELISALDRRLYDTLVARADIASLVACMEWKHMFVLVMRTKADGETLEQLLLAAGVDRNTTKIGISFLHDQDASFGMALSEAIYAVRAARATGARTMRAGEMGLQAYLLPVSENAFACEWCKRSMSIIAEYDKQNGSSLWFTARTYIAQNMDVAATARALFQHPNTVRYRIGKVARLMGMEENALFEPMLALMVCLWEIIEAEEKTGFN